MARLAVIAVGDAKARIEDDLARVLDALAAVEEGGHRSEAKIARLTVEQTSLLLKLKASKDEVSSLHSQEGKDKEAMKEGYQKALEMIFSYGYGCCTFKHSICGDHPEIPDDMHDSTDPLPLEFFCEPKVPPDSTTVKVKVVEIDLGEAVKNPEEGVIVEEYGRVIFLC